MLEDVQFGFEQNHMVYSACRDCAYFRAICLDGNRGFCCSNGKSDDYFVPFSYPRMDKGGRLDAIGKYQSNPLPEDCVFHTQCSMLNFMEDDSVADEIASEEFEIADTTVGELDRSDPVFREALERDTSLGKWMDGVKDATAIVLKKDGVAHAFAFMTVEKGYDYSWIQPSPPSRFYLHEGRREARHQATVVGRRNPNGLAVLLSLAYSKAIDSNVDELYAISYSDTGRMLRLGGFKSAGYMFGGEGKDDDACAEVLVKKLRDLEEGE